MDFYKLDNGNVIIGNHELIPNTFHCLLYANNTCILIKSNDGSQVYYNDYIDNLVNIDGNVYDDATDIQNVYIPIVSITDPVLVSAATNVEGSKVILTFNKSMRNPVLYSDDFTMSIGGQDDPITLVALGSNTKTIELTSTAGFIWGDEVLVSVKSDNVKSTDSGVLGYLIDNPVVNNYPAEVPVLSDASTNADGSLIILTFDIDMIDPATNIADFGLKVGGVTKVITSIALGVDTTTIEITPTVPIVFGDVVTITVISGNIVGANEHGLLATILNEAVTNIIPNNIPTLVTASTNVGGTLAILTFDMDMSNPTHSSDFTVKVGGNPVTITGVALGSNIAIIEVTPTAAFVNGNVITISLASGRLKSVANGFLVTVTDRSVTNIVA